MNVSSGPKALWAKQAPPIAARFTQGSILGHVLVMTATSMLGLLAIFFVDALSLFYISQLDSDTKRAAVGFASQILFFALSINIGTMIAVSALVSKKLGEHHRRSARFMAGSGLIFMVSTSALTALIFWMLRDTILFWLNARGEVAVMASQYLAVTLPANILLALGIAYSSVLRAAGAPWRAMFVTLAGGLITIITDPLFIFIFKLDLLGAALAVVVARLVFALVGYWGAVHVKNLVLLPRIWLFRLHLRQLLKIAFPAILTNLATPFGNAILAYSLADYGEYANAAYAVMDRINPLAFGGLFALTGAIGPILAQNWGAGLFARMRRTFLDSLLLSLLYVLVVWAVLVVGSDYIVAAYRVKGETATLLKVMCWWSGPAWLGIGALFVANVVFNNLGKPLLATGFNWGRTLFGTLPFAIVGGFLNGAIGVIEGVYCSSILIGTCAAICGWQVIKNFNAAKAK